MLQRLLFIALLLLGVLPSAIPTPTPARAHAAAVDYRECVVYVTRTGHRYHVDGCQYLRRSRIPMTRREAEINGYTPCRVCGGSRC